MVGHEHAAVAVDLEAVGLAVVLQHHLERAGGRDAQQAAVRQVHAPQVAVAVEGRALEERVHLDVPVGEPLRRPVGLVQRLGQLREDFRVEDLGRREHAFSPPEVRG